MDPYAASMALSRVTPGANAVAIQAENVHKKGAPQGGGEMDVAVLVLLVKQPQFTRVGSPTRGDKGVRVVLVKLLSIR